MKQAPDPLYFLIFFPLLWFAVTMLLSFLSGWFGLMERFPDRAENPLLTLTGQSGSLGKVSMSRILTLSVCPTGLRIGIMRIFGPFSRDFLVPWDEITGARWPESGSFPEETGNEALSRVVNQWLAATCLAAAFFCIAPRLMGPKGVNGPPIAVAVLFPAIVFGIGAMVQYFRRNRP